MATRTTERRTLIINDSLCCRCGKIANVYLGTGKDMSDQRDLDPVVCLQCWAALDAGAPRRPRTEGQ